MHKHDIQYLISIKHHIFTSVMHNLKSNYDRFFRITKSVFKNRINSFDNFYCYRNRPKMSDCQIIAFSITGESLGIDSEAFLWAKIKSEHAVDFPNLIDRSNFNRRRKRLYPFIEALNRTIASFLNKGEDCFLVDSIPILFARTPVNKEAGFARKTMKRLPAKDIRR